MLCKRCGRYKDLVMIMIRIKFENRALMLESWYYLDIITWVILITNNLSFTKVHITFFFIVWTYHQSGSKIQITLWYHLQKLRFLIDVNQPLLSLGFQADTVPWTNQKTAEKRRKSCIWWQARENRTGSKHGKSHVTRISRTSDARNIFGTIVLGSKTRYPHIVDLELIT